MPAAPASVDVVALASNLRLSVARLARKLRRESSESLSPTLLAALATIEAHGPLTPGAIAQHEQVRKPTVTHTIAALAEHGLIERTPDLLDGRVAWVQITPEGHKLLQRIRRRGDEYLARHMKNLDPEELTTLEHASAILERLTEGDR